MTAVAKYQDHYAFEQLFRYFAPRVKAYLIKLGLGHAEAEELAQETMVTLWRRAASFDGARASLGTWIFTIARNLRIDALRRLRTAEKFQDEAPTLMTEPAGERLVEARQQEEKIAAALECLPAEQLEVVRLAYFDDLAHGKIAADYRLPLGTVKSRLRLAVRRLKIAMAEGDE